MNGHHLKLLKELSKDNKLSQRELSKKLGVSLDSVNYMDECQMTSHVTEER